MCKTQSGTSFYSQMNKLTIEKIGILQKYFIYRTTLNSLFRWVEHVLVWRRTNHDESDNALQNNSNSDSRAVSYSKQPCHNCALSFPLSSSQSIGLNLYLFTYPISAHSFLSVLGFFWNHFQVWLLQYIPSFPCISQMWCYSLAGWSFITITGWISCPVIR